MPGVVVAVVVAVLALPGSALAAKVEVTSSTAEEGDLNEARFTAAVGESNNVTVALLAGGKTLTIAFRDTSAPVAPGEGCTASGPNQATCKLPLGSFDTSVSVDLEDGDDRVDATAFDPGRVSFSAEGGPGSDAITGSGRGVNALFGDGIVGAGGAVDTIRGGPEDDFMIGGGGADSIDGRGGRDQTSLRDERSAVVVDLVRGFSQAPTGRDTLRNVEDAEGGDGPDTLLGNARRNFLEGEGGRDRLVGRDGNDRLDGGDGPDSLFGGNGSDRLTGRAGNDTLFGGNGDDKLFGQGDRDVLSAGSGADWVLSADKLRERVNCGSGRRDRVTADRRDRVRACEHR